LENVSDALIIIGEILIFIMALSSAIYHYNGFQVTIDNILTTSEKYTLNAASSEQFNESFNFERFASKAEVINTILSMKKDVKRSDEYNSIDNKFYYDYYYKAFVPSKVIIKGTGYDSVFSLYTTTTDSSASNSDNGLQRDGRIYSMTYNSLIENNTVKDGVYSIRYNAIDNNNIEIEYTWAGNSLEEARG